MSSISFSGGGGFDVDLAVQQIMHAERAPARALERERSYLSARLSALGRFESLLKDLSSSADSLTGASVLSPRTVSSSNESTVSASAAPGAQTGEYRIEVTQLAARHSLATQGFAALTSAVPSGSFDLVVGGSEAVTIDLPEGSTLESLRDAIIASGANVQAVILHDGDDYHLSLTSGASGSAGEISLQNFSSSQLQNALDFSQVKAAQDAQFTVNGLTLTRSSNQITDAVEGVTFSLHNETAGEVVVNVGSDPEATVASLREFVDAYNALASMVRAQLADPTRGFGSIVGLTSVRQIQETLQSIVSRSVSGLGGDLVNLRQAGLEMQNDGSFSIDEAKLRAAIDEGGLEGLLGLSGRTTDSRVVYGAGTSATQAGTYEVFITQAAEQASVTGTETFNPPGLSQDETLTFSRGDTTVEVQLSQHDDLEDVIETINAALAGTGIKATASDDGSGHLKITSTVYGSAATVDVVSDQSGAGSTGIGTTGLNDAGLDVEGTIGGETAIGIGRNLSANAGDPKGLSLEVRVDPGAIAPGGSSVGDAVVSLGVAEALHRRMDMDLSASSGRIAQERSGIEKTDRMLEDRIATLDRRLSQRQVSLTQQLGRANRALLEFENLSQTIQSQLNMLKK